MAREQLTRAITFEVRATPNLRSPKRSEAMKSCRSPGTDRWSADNSTVERLEALLAEVSVVAFPAFLGAIITDVRTLPSFPFDLSRRPARIPRKELVMTTSLHTSPKPAPY